MTCLNGMGVQNHTENSSLWSTCADENICSVLSIIVDSLHFTNWSNSILSLFGPLTLKVWLMSSHSQELQVMSGNGIRHYSSKQHSSRLKWRPFFSLRKVPSGRLHKPRTWYNQISEDGEKKKKGGWKKDGIQIEDRKTVWMRGDKLMDY